MIAMTVMLWLIMQTTEVCDGSDNDCDNQIDEGVSATYYLDNDCGNPNASTNGCSQPKNYVTNTNDCNDSNALACVGLRKYVMVPTMIVTTKLAKVQTIYFSDSDGDGYGNNNSGTYACSKPPNHIENNTVATMVSQQHIR